MFREFDAIVREEQREMRRKGKRSKNKSLESPIRKHRRRDGDDDNDDGGRRRRRKSTSKRGSTVSTPTTGFFQNLTAALARRQN